MTTVSLKDRIPRGLLVQYTEGPYREVWTDFPVTPVGRYAPMWLANPAMADEDIPPPQQLRALPVPPSPAAPPPAPITIQGGWWNFVTLE